MEEDTDLYCADNLDSDGSYSDDATSASYSDSDSGYSDDTNMVSYPETEGGYSDDATSTSYPDSDGGYLNDITSDAAAAHVTCPDDDVVLNHESAGLNKVAAAWAIGAAVLAPLNPVAGVIAGAAAGGFWLWGSEKSEEAATNDDEAIRKCEEEQSH